MLRLHRNQSRNACYSLLANLPHKSDDPVSTDPKPIPVTRNTPYPANSPTRNLLRSSHPHETTAPREAFPAGQPNPTHSASTQESTSRPTLTPRAKNQPTQLPATQRYRHKPRTLRDPEFAPDATMFSRHPSGKQIECRIASGSHAAVEAPPGDRGCGSRRDRDCGRGRVPANFGGGRPGNGINPAHRKSVRPV